VARALGDRVGAEALLAQSRLCFTDPDAGAIRVFDEEAVAQALRFDPSKAPLLVAALDHDRLPARMARVRIALVEHDASRAAALLADLPPATTRRQRVERSVLCALCEGESSVERVNVHLQSAIEDGRPEWLIRSIIDQGPGVGELLASFTPDGSQERYVDALITAADRTIASPSNLDTPQTLVDPLSARELTVLRYLCSRLTYQEIAAALYVSLNTLKSHVKSIYRKLDVASRADAVDAGRRLGVI
jgi:LuxR family maltose regulon positive regulatory protein